MQGRTCTDLPLQALLMAVWRRKPKAKVYVHSDQGSQFSSYEWQEFLEQHSFCRCPVICRTRKTASPETVCRSETSDQVSLGFAQRSVVKLEREIESRRHCIPTDSLGLVRSIMSRLISRPKA